MELPDSFDAGILMEIVQTKMPFGKFKNSLLCDLPEFYLAWFLKKGGFPKGKLGQMLATVYEIKLNGLDYLLEPLKSRKSGFNDH